MVIMEFNDLLMKHDVEPVLVMRHRPKEPELRKVLPWLANERPAVFNAYQQTQKLRAEKKVMKARYVASFIGNEPGKALFVGMYKVQGWKKHSRAELRKIPAYAAVVKNGINDAGPKRLWFKLKLTELFAEWKGKLIVRWPSPEIVWCRWANANKFDIEAILDESILVGDLRNWRECVFTWDDLQLMPKRWKDMLKQWRGIYFIWDSKDNMGYVGAACGNEGIYGRWINYAKSGHGGNKFLKNRNPESFRFSILEWAAPELEDGDIRERERSWKERLHTRAPQGLNDN
ncbi:MAG: GIY-YIG nuclease family protein [Planctomycetaceae bacterium]|nr:hypothetical protein [Planctomycetales bacterium]MCB9875747.1 GIY-YIG nuclease family protein [Planctomycetaceae bacterium]HRX80797.1 hypothetical protein [Pirellulaceae bacterium]